MSKLVTLDFHAGKLKFSAGHFTMFSATEREPLHGHNYTLSVSVTAAMSAPGITFDYRVFEKKLIEICKRLHLRCLMPANSPYLKIEEEDQHYAITFNKATMQLLKEDVILLPLQNISLEELSQWFIDQLTAEKDFLAGYQVKEVLLKVFNGPAHSAQAKVEL